MGIARSGSSHSSSPVPTDRATSASSPRHVLPKDLPNAIKQLNDPELEQLLAAVLAERRRRGKPSVSDLLPSKRAVTAAAAPLTTGKLNAVRAAFKAGVKVSQISRQFGLSQSDVRKALASNQRR